MCITSLRDRNSLLSPRRQDKMTQVGYSVWSESPDGSFGCPES